MQSATFGYDSLGRRVTATDPRTGTTTYQLDALGRTVAVTTPAPGNGQSPQTTRYGYDELGRLTAVTNGDGTVTHSDYFDTGELRQTWGSRAYPVGYTYDYAGRMKTMTTWQDFAATNGAATTTWSYDLRGFLTSKVYQDPGNWTTYTYTPAGRLATRAWARGVTTFYTNDAAGGLAGIGYSDPTHSVVYQFDRLGRKTEIVDATGTHALRYDPAGHLLAETNTAGPLAGAGLTNAYDSLGHRTGLSLRLPTSGLSYSYAYDGASRLQTVTGAVESATYSYLAKASLVGQIELRHSGAIAMTTTKQYDHLNRLTQVRTVGASPLPLGSFDYAYNDANQRVRVTEADGSSWRYEYDALGQVTSGQKYWSDGTPVSGQQFRYEFDDIGNRTETKTGGDARGTGLRPAAYANNLLNQITCREVPGTVDILGIAHPNATLTVNGQSSYRRGEYYDQVLAWNNSNAVVSAWVTNTAVLSGATSNATGRVLLPQTPESPTYDSDGNLTQDGLWNYTWDAENRLISMESGSGVPADAKRKLEFAYDWQSRRVSKKVSDWNVASNAYVLSTNLLFAYDGWNLVAILNSSLRAQISFAWGTDLSGTLQGAGGVGGLLWLTDHAFPTTRYFPCYDGNGNVKALVNANDGSVSANYDYGPFGELLRATGPRAKVNPFRFSTKYQDDESDLVYYGYRYMSSSTGRWLSRDPVGENGGRAIYVLLGNAPISRNDSLGLVSSRDSIEVIQEAAMDLVENAIAIGWDVAANMLLNYLVGGGDQTVSVEWLRGFGKVTDAEEKVQWYFESRTFHDLIDKLSCGETRSFEDHWDARITYSSRAYSTDELFYASGDSHVTGFGSFMATKTCWGESRRRGAFCSCYRIDIWGGVTYWWNDDYNWNAGAAASTPFGMVPDAAMDKLRKEGSAKPFHMSASWSQAVVGHLFNCPSYHEQFSYTMK